MFRWVKELVGGSNEKELRKLQPLVQRINSLEPQFQALSAPELSAQSARFKERLARGEGLEALLPEAFAAVREAAVRAIGQRHFDVQLLGGMVLHQGKITEMKTGEGKTLVATLPLYLNALAGRGCHLVTVNDYLAKRDPHWMGPIYAALGLTVASIQHDSSFLFDPAYDSGDPRWRHLRAIPRREAYRADITYGTNNEFGFDFLRDNMVTDPLQQAQRELNYAIVDEVDNILIDEARTPLIISGATEESTDKYHTFARLASRFQAGADYQIDERTRAVTLTEAGITKIEQALSIPNLYDPEYFGLTQFVENALRAQVLYKRDRDYVVKEGEVIIVDEFTGRLMLGRRYGEGLHQAIEAKEGVKVQRETVTLATITFQNYFRLYKKLAGMTGTAATEAEEFYKIYGLDVVVIPTHQPMIRQDANDRVYKTEDGKFRAVVEEIGERHRKGQPVLVGTVSIENSERLSALLKTQGVPHQVLNAKFHEQEAAIVAQAGRRGAVTIATNMAGRGTDIILGGNPAASLQAVAQANGNTAPQKAAALKSPVEQDWQAEHDQVVSLGGLHIVGTERHEARRIDNQLRGRAGRQGDPGSSRFFLSLDDDLLKRFGGERLKGIMNWAGLDENTPIENPLVNRTFEAAQVKMEGYNFDIRRHLVEYDDVMNKHREVVYAERRKILAGADLKANIQGMVRQEIEALADDRLPTEDGQGWDLEGLLAALKAILPLPPTLTEEGLARMSRPEARAALLGAAQDLYQAREQELGPENMRMLERLVLLRVLDAQWVEHLTAMENTRQGIGLQAYGQSDPLVAYKKEAHTMYDNLMVAVRQDVARTIFHVGIARETPAQTRTAVSAGAQRREAAPVTAKVGRNDPCPCGSGKKYKKCHGRPGP
ncbi:MAG: preprotein translocase subunit SecA [Chloroflexi bacterium]|nr:preprotein translocase subunit SecA [Chloroflexota bacterium]